MYYITLANFQYLYVDILITSLYRLITAAFIDEITSVL